MNDRAFFMWLCSHGFGRDQDSEEVRIRHYRIEARCFSLECGKPKSGILRSVPRTDIFCPKCEHALVWRRTVIRKRK
jgi:hypothetical protein